MIRSAILSDVRNISQILIQSWKTAYEGIIDPEYSSSLTEEKFVKIFNENISQNKEIINVYEIDSHVIGFVSAKIGEMNGSAEIVGLYVDPNFRNRSIGSKLFDSVIDYFRKTNCTKIYLKTLYDAMNNKFYIHKKGKIKEYIELKFGNKNYNGVIFEFNI